MRRQIRLVLDGLLLFDERVEVPSHDHAFMKVPGRFFKLPNQLCVPTVLTRLIQGVLAANELLLNVLNVKRLHGLRVVFVVGIQQVVLACSGCAFLLCFLRLKRGALSSDSMSGSEIPVSLEGASEPPFKSVQQPGLFLVVALRRCFLQLRGRLYTGVSSSPDMLRKVCPKPSSSITPTSSEADARRSRSAKPRV